MTQLSQPNIHPIFQSIFKFIHLFFCCWMISHSAFAAESAKKDAATNLSAAKRFGVVWRISGVVTANTDPAAKTIQSRQLREGSPVFVGEHIRAASNGEAVIKTEDSGIVALRPGVEFIAEAFAAEGKKTDNMTLRLFSGSLRVITGWIGKINRSEDRIITLTSTIGIRGTDHEPYVLTADLATSTQYKPGTYDKVNRGKTSLGEGEQTLEIDSGRVGFARASTFQAKGLMTILMPVLLDKVPNFYVPGQFDAELDQLSSTIEIESAKQLENKRKAALLESTCVPTKIAKKWLDSFDHAVVKRDATTVMSLFSPDVAVVATVRGSNNEMTSVTIDREEMTQSTIAAVKGLKQYKQRRLTLDAEKSETANEGACDRINVRSAVIEQGVQSGKPYRFESTEEYLLELSEGKWLAVKASTKQK
jgi:hypothetical protein